MKRAVLLSAVSLVVAGLLLAAPHLSKEAAAVTVGVVCGVGASIPVSLGLLLILGRLPGRSAPAHSDQRPSTPSSALVEMKGHWTPPVIIIERPPARPPDWAETVQALGYPHLRLVKPGDRP